jgi:hypothetical protein
LLGFAALDATWQEAPAYRPLFAPRKAHSDAYRMYVSTLDLDAALRALAADDSLLRPPGAWQAQPVLPFDAFGQTGSYDRWKLARLYGARRPLVARGPKAENGRIVESWTLVSPYPDPSFERLEPGTLLIVLRLP